MTDPKEGCAEFGGHRQICVSDCVPNTSEQATPLRAAWRTGRLVAAMALVVPVALLIAALPGYAAQRRRSWVLSWCSRTVLAGAGISVEMIGVPRPGPCLVVANHTSWLDVVVLCAYAPMIPVAKSEVANWPLVGTLARRCGALFVARDSLRQLPLSVEAITAAMRSGHRVQVFPEATTRCGLAVGEFYRASFQAAVNAAVVVQPAVLSYRNIENRTTALAFVGQEEVASAVRRALRMSEPRVELRWLPAIPAIAGTGRDAVDRASVANLTQNAIARALNQPIVRRRAQRQVGRAAAPLKFRAAGG